jgi:microcin C transport system permease protein
MGLYVLRRLALLVPTLLGILLINFAVVQVAPGGPVEAMMHQLQEQAGAGGHTASQGITEDMRQRLEAQFGFDKPAHERFWLMLVNYLHGDFGESFYRQVSVLSLIAEKMPVSISLGLWSTLLIYGISIPLGIKKALRHGSRFDAVTSVVLSLAYAVPGFLLAILLIVLFAGGSYWQWFPLRGLYSENFAEMTWYQQIADYLWHITLPLICYTISGFTALTLLTKNSFLEEISKQYVATARAKGLTERRVLYGHVFRNAMLIIISGFPAAFVSVFFSGALLIEVVFSLDGLGLLTFEAVTNRDYPVFFGTLFIFTLLGLVVKLLSDLLYVWIDPRISFASQER